MRRTHLHTQALALLDMYDALSSVSDDLAETLAGPRFLPLLTRLAELADAAQDEFEAMFADFEAGLGRADTWKAAVTNGSVRGGGAMFLWGRGGAVFGAAVRSIGCDACMGGASVFAAQTARVRRMQQGSPLHPPPLTTPHHPLFAPQTSGPPRRCADIGALGRSVCAPAGAAAAAASVSTLCRPALQVGAQCVATVPRCGVGGPRAYGAGIRVGRQNARLQVQGAAISLLGGQATARCFPCLSRRPPLLLPSPGPGRRLCSQQRHLRHGDSRVEPCSRPARRDLARVARRRGESREEEREKTPITTTPPPSPPPPHPPGRRPPA